VVAGVPALGGIQGDRRKDDVVKIYLAGPYADMEELQGWADALELAGHECTSRWLKEDPELPMGSSPADAARGAQMDLDDIDRSDAVICKIFPRGTLITGGGRHIEFGYAINESQNRLVPMRLICIGVGAETVFHHLPQIELYPDFMSALQALGWKEPVRLLP
jgi:hypothetical protein